jgi:hypothetical protein
MPKHRVILAAILVVLSVGALTPQFAQDSANSDKSDQQKLRRALLIGLMRTINTDEVTERTKYGSYASWQTLFDHQPEYFNRWLARFRPDDPTLRFADTPEILPGVTLRLNAHADGQGYDVRLQDTPEQKYGYAAFSDESGVIWEGQPLQ